VSRQTVALIESALHYARQGRAVFPVHEKRPMTAHGLHDATTDEAIIREWWARWPDAGVAIRTGSVSGLIVLDVDPKAGGDENLARLEAAHGPLPETPEAITGGGGRHLLFAHPGTPVGNSAGALGPGLDVRGDGGYIVAPPSRHASGRCYEWDLLRHPDDVPLAPAPAWLLARLQAGHEATNGNGHAGEDWAALLCGAAQGQRHAIVVRIAGHYLGLGIPATEVEQICLGFAARCRPTHDPDDVRRVVYDLAAKDAAKEPPSPDAEPLGIGLGEFLAQAFPPLEPIVEGLLYTDGGGWIGGEEKLGKSYYAVEEALSIGLGIPVCGRFAVPQRRRVFFIEEEDPPRRLHARVNALLRGRGLDPTDPALRAELNEWVRLAVWTGFSFDVPGLVARLDATCRTFRPAVIYGDVLRKLSHRDLNKSPEAGALLATLDRLRREYGVVFRILHHYRKTQGFRAGRGSQELGGSFQLGAWAEQSLYFEPVGRKQGAVKVEVQSKDAPPAPAFKLVFESEGPVHDPLWVRLRAEDLTESSVRERNLDAVLQALATLPPTTPVEGAAGVAIKDLVAALKLAEKTIRTCLKDLETGGKAAVIGKATKGAALWAATGQ
jgi:hypothetical protein